MYCNFFYWWILGYVCDYKCVVAKTNNYNQTNSVYCIIRNIITLFASTKKIVCSQNWKLNFYNLSSTACIERSKHGPQNNITQMMTVLSFWGDLCLYSTIDKVDKTHLTWTKHNPNDIDNMDSLIHLQWWHISISQNMKL